MNPRLPKWCDVATLDDRAFELTSDSGESVNLTIGKRANFPESAQTALADVVGTTGPALETRVSALSATGQ